MSALSSEKCGETKVILPPDDVHIEANRNYDTSREPVKTEFKCGNKSCEQINFIYWYKTIHFLNKLIIPMLGILFSYVL